MSNGSDALHFEFFGKFFLRQQLQLPPIPPYQRLLFLVTPRLDHRFTINRIMNIQKIYCMHQFHRSSVVCIGPIVDSLSMLFQPARQVIRHASVVAPIRTPQDVDTKFAHGMTLLSLRLSSQIPASKSLQSIITISLQKAMTGRSTPSWNKNTGPEERPLDP